MAKEADLGTRLQAWMLEEMHFHSHISTGNRLPTLEDFKMLCRGPNAKIWRWVIGRMRSAETVKTVRGNIALKSQTSRQACTAQYTEKGEVYDEEKSALLQRRAELRGEITSTLRDRGHLQGEIERIVQETADTDCEYQKQLESVHNIRRKAALLRAFTMKCGDSALEYEEYIKCIGNRADTVKERARKGMESEEYYSKETGSQHGGNTDSARLETACNKHVRETCEAIGSFLQDTLKGTFGSDKSEFARKKEPLWQKVEHVMSTYACGQIVDSLLTNTRETTAVLRDMTDSVDIRQDAKALRFKYESNGEMRDLCTPPSLLRSVQQILKERAGEHFEMFMVSQKCTNERSLLEKKLSTTRGHIDRRLQKLFTRRDADLKMTRSLVELELEIEGYRAVLHCQSTEGNRLREIVERSYQEKQVLITKHHQIQEFQKITDKKQSLIQMLVKQNINSQSRLDAQIGEIQQYIERALKCHQNQIEAVSTKLHHCVSSEVTKFTNLSLPYLMFSQIDNALKTAVIDLSIQKLSPSFMKPELSKVLHCLSFASFQAPELVLQRCAEMKRDIVTMLDQLETEERARQWDKDVKEGQDVTTTIVDLCAAMRLEDEKQLSQSLPLLQQKLNKTKSTVADCARVKEIAEMWWEQPAQNCVPWVTVDDKNLQHYMARWKVLVTRLRQLLIN